MKSEVLENVLKKYQAYFDIERDVVIKDIEFYALCAFHSKSEKYVLTKKAKLWGAENHEYVYVVWVDVLDLDTAKRYEKAALEDGLLRINPHNEHMFTDITLIMAANQIAEEAKTYISKCRHHKDFMLSIHGWMDFRWIVTESESATLISNRIGKKLRILFSQ